MLEARTSGAFVQLPLADQCKTPPLRILRDIRSLQECKEPPRYPTPTNAINKSSLSGRPGGARTFRHVLVQTQLAHRSEEGWQEFPISGPSSRAEQVVVSDLVQLANDGRFIHFHATRHV